MGQVGFLKVNSSNLDKLITLSVGDSQEHLISENAVWLAEAGVMDDSMNFGIFLEGQAAGLISFIDPRILASEDDHFHHDCLYVWRVMVDQKFQGKGLGREAVDFALNFARILGLKGVTLTTMDQEKGNALNFYLSLGFEPTGRRLEDEIELIRRL